MLKNTQVTRLIFRQREIFVKRDDLLHPEFSGNKARKFAYFLEHDFPKITKLVGYGSPQANSLYSMSALAKLRGWQLDFYVDHIAEQVQRAPMGNYAAALANGANIIDLSAAADRQGRDCLSYIQQLVIPGQEHILFVPEGGRCEYAQYGVGILAQEIIDWAAEQGLQDLAVFLPSGTGTTAVFLSQYFKRRGANIEVLTCAAVGGDDYLKAQFSELVPEARYHPQIVSLTRKYHFGKLYREFYDVWRSVCASGIEFELLYDPLGWLAVDKLISEGRDGPILYLHQGGLLGNESMLPRYRRKYG